MYAPFRATPSPLKGDWIQYLYHHRHNFFANSDTLLTTLSAKPFERAAWLADILCLMCNKSAKCVKNAEENALPRSVMIPAGTPSPVPVPAHGVHRHSLPRNENSPKLALRGCGYVNVLTIGLGTGEGVAKSLNGGADGHTNFGVNCG